MEICEIDKNEDQNKSKPYKNKGARKVKWEGQRRTEYSVVPNGNTYVKDEGVNRKKKNR